MKLTDHAEFLCKHLPEGWSISIELERGAATVKAHRPDGSEVMTDDGESDVDEQVRAAYRLALDETKANAKMPDFEDLLAPNSVATDASGCDIN